MTDRPSTKKAFVKIMEEEGRIDCLVNNAEFWLTHLLLC